MAFYAQTTRCTESSDCGLNKAPAWLSEELLQKTMTVWQPFYPNPLTEDDARQIILSVGRLIDVVGDSIGNRSDDSF